WAVVCFGGGGEIRTHERLPFAGFQDRCNRPLCHTSITLLNTENRRPVLAPAATLNPGYAQVSLRKCGAPRPVQSTTLPHRRRALIIRNVRIPPPSATSSLRISFHQYK